MKQVSQQLLRLWRELGINQRITLGVSAAVVLAGMIALLAWAQRPQMKLLYGKLGDKEAAEVVAAIQAQNIPYELGAGGSSIFVPSTSVYKLRMDLAAKGLPGSDGVGFEIFDRSNFGISDFVQRTNYLRALQGELARTIGQLKGVRSARVMVVMPENRLLLKSAESRPTASVFVDASNMESSAVNSIRSLVANSVEGLRLDDVAVIDSRGNVLSEELKSDPSLGTASSQIKFRKQTEDYLAGKVETMLAKVLGPGNAVVRVSAEINTEAITTTEEKFDPESQVVRTETNTEDSSITNEKNGDRGGAVGVTANIPGEQSTAGANTAPAKSSEDLRKSKTQSYEINRLTKSTTKNPGAITRLTAAVFVAQKITGVGDKAAATPRPPEEITALRRMVVNALGVQVTKTLDLDSIVSLQEVPFQALPEPGAMSAEKLSPYLELARPFSAVVIALVIFWFFVRLLKRTKPDEIQFEVIEKSDGTATPHQPRIKSNTVSPELLNDLIRQKPENVGATLRDWLGAKADN